MVRGERPKADHVVFFLGGQRVPFERRSGSKVCLVSIILLATVRSLSAMLLRARACLCPRLLSRKFLGAVLNNSLNVQHILWIPAVRPLDTLLREGLPHGDLGVKQP